MTFDTDKLEETDQRTSPAAKTLSVAMICQRDDVAAGGAARVAAELTKRLANEGVEAICIFAYGGPGGISQEIRPQSRWLEIRSPRQVLIGFFRLRREIQDFDPDIIYHHDGLTWTHFVSWTFPKRLVIGHAHLDGPQHGASRRRRFAHWVHMRTYQYLFAVSQFTRRQWLNSGYPDANALVLCNGVDASTFHPAQATDQLDARTRLGLPAGVKVLASVGRLHCGMKGTDDFLRVLARMGPEWHGLIAGTGPDRMELEALATNLDLEERIHFAGLVDPVITAYHASDAMAITSHYEPFGLIAVEALACGLPVVCFECRGGVVEILSAAGQKVVAGRDLDAMCSAIKTAAGNSQAQRDKLLATYNWNAAARQLASRLRDWVGSHQR